MKKIASINLFSFMLGLTLISLTAAQPSKAATIHTNPANGNKYFLTESGSWFDANNQAFSELGTGKLVKINDANELNWLRNKFLNSGSPSDAWIGLSDAAQEGVWRWEDGTIADYKNWYYLNDDWKEPNNKWDIENYVLMGKDGTWNDFIGSGTNPDGIKAFFPGIAEIDPLETPSFGATASLVFQANGDIRIPGYWDHAGLDFNGWIYESTQAFITTPITYDGAKDIAVEKDDGVQNQRTIEVMKKWQHHKDLTEIPISYSLAKAMAGTITGKLDAGYATIPSFKTPSLVTTAGQKGEVNGTFGCAGLLEWAAEQAQWYNQGQGFIPNNREYIFVQVPVGQICIALKGCYTVTLPVKIPTITPQLLYWASTKPENFFKNGSALQGLFDPVDFILTDPLGRRLGYTAELGLINEIPDAFYTGDDWAEQLYISNLLAGDYTLDLFGLGDEAKIALGDSTDGIYFEGFLAQGERRTFKFTNTVEDVPEPSSILGLLATIGVGAFLKFKKRKQSHSC